MALSNVGDEFDMRIDGLPALRDFLDAHERPQEAVVTEAVANAIDAGARIVNVMLDGRTESISFHSDGPPMSKSQFQDYHAIAKPSKAKRSGIGFAGIGAKAYLAAWDRTVIRTEVAGGGEAMASEMYVRKGRLRARYTRPRIRRCGTTYRVKLKPDDYAYLAKRTRGLISEAFGPAIDRGLRVYVNGSRIASWALACEMQKEFAVTVMGSEFPVMLTVTMGDLPPGRHDMQYHVSGKVISTKKAGWMADLKPAYAGRVHAYVDATRMPGGLNLNKTAFKRISAVRAVYSEVERRAFGVLRKAGYAKDQAVVEWARAPLIRFFDRLFEHPEFAFLSPGAAGGRAKRTGTGGSSLSIELRSRKDDPREGWLDPRTGRVIINVEHPLYIKYGNVSLAKSQREIVVITTVLLRNAAAKGGTDAVEALDVQGRVLTMARDVSLRC